MIGVINAVITVVINVISAVVTLVMIGVINGVISAVVTVLLTVVADVQAGFSISISGQKKPHSSHLGFRQTTTHFPRLASGGVRVRCCKFTSEARMCSLPKLPRGQPASASADLAEFAIKHAAQTVLFVWRRFRLSFTSSG